MSNTQVGKLHKNKIVKDLRGKIIDWFDEADGGWIIKSRQVVNKERWEKELLKQKDKAEAAKAITLAKVADEQAETQQPKEISTASKKLEERVDKMEETLQAILKAVQK